MLKQIVLSAALLGVSTAALAQSAAAPAAAKPQTQAQAAPALTPEQQAQLREQNTKMEQAALQVALQVDQGKTGSVWDGASSVAKQAVQRDAFVKQVDADRKQAGNLVSRKFATITRSASQGGATPAGYYVNVSFATQFANRKQPIRELISFHLDTDKVWRVAGYTLR
ncbi:DUF4019 domain-containing protein [Rhodanobacter sp. PCA2]|uniref:DUF4019 domain-containing protein n=1 Tax=Rhodanobacter sp. PCA2 TaxID=2006117 RepID=UPI0015E7D24C|nr:DUF4019 domain-containing protein [Rhodanobacter sp. PCA2]MBA2079283.1 hypothetical protein [Rhodanobacter sp. PCA2]